MIVIGINEGINASVAVGRDGEIVFALLDAGLLGKTAEDKIADFDDLYDFDSAFRAPFRPKPRRRTLAPSRPLESKKEAGP